MGDRFTRRNFIKATGLGASGLMLGFGDGDRQSDSRQPNIVWILAEDIGPDLSCYGVKGVTTPHLDRLASEGARYTHAFCTSPVCSPSRSAMMTGMHQNSINAHQHRTPDKQPLPEGVYPITHHLREAGYFTALGCGSSAKTDLNFTHTRLFDGKDWSERSEDQPFFAQITLANTHRAWKRDKQRPIDPEAVEIPPYYPDHPLVRRDWANGLEEIQIMDRKVGEVLARLEEEKIADQTVVIFCGDNGRCHIRDKQFLYDGGIHVPLIFRWPGKVAPGTVNSDLVSTIDISAAILAMAGVQHHPWIYGRNFLDADSPKGDRIFAARDKMDDTHDCMRAVRTKDFKYIFNLMPERPWCQFNQYKELQYPVLALMNVLHLEGKLLPEQDRFMQPVKPVEELYDLRQDPHEIHNVAEDPEYKEVRREMRAALQMWRDSMGDRHPTKEFREGGWPATYPTRSLEAWKETLQVWEKHIFNGGPRPPRPAPPEKDK